MGIQLIDDMIITGHFSTDSLIIRRSYFPSQFGILRSSEICDAIFCAADIDKGVDGNGCIEFEQMGQAMLKLAEGRRLWETCFGFFLPNTYKPWLHFGIVQIGVMRILPMQREKKNED